MCSATAAVSALSGAAALAAKPDVPKPETTSQVTKNPDWWDRPETKEGLSGNYRLNRQTLRSRAKASRGTGQLQVPLSKTSKSTGKQASKKRQQLQVK